MRAKARIFVSEDRGWSLDLDGVLDMAFELVGELIDSANDFEMVSADDLPHSPLANFQIIHPGFQSADVALDLYHVTLKHGDIGFEHGDIGFDLHDIGIHPLDRGEYQVALVHATAPAIVMSLYAIHRSDAIKE
jgi:hypothetical protein